MVPGAAGEGDGARPWLGGSLQGGPWTKPCGGVAQAGLFRRRGSAAAEQAGGGAIPEAGRVGGGASGGAGASRCRRAGWQAAGPQWPGVWAARPADGHGLLSGPRRHRWRRRSARLGVVRLRLGLGTRDQNALGGADAAPAGFSGKVAPSPAPCLPWTAMAVAARAAGPGPEAAAAPHSALGLRLRGRTACLGLGTGGGGGGGGGSRDPPKFGGEAEWAELQGRLRGGEPRWRPECPTGRCAARPAP